MVDRRLVVVLVDGIGDVNLPQLADMTPLQVADIPMFDAIAAAGLTGLMDSVEPGRACGSDTSHLGIFGYEPRLTYRGRGAFESMGAGCSMNPGDIAFKCNFATIDDATGIVTHRRVDRDFDKEGPILCAFLDGLELPDFPDHKVQVRYATEHRCGVVVQGPRLSDEVSDTDPLKDNLQLLQSKPKDDSSEAAHTCAIVNQLSDCIRAKLRQHPINAQRAAEGKNVANVVLLRGCGVRLKLDDFQDKHGLKACIIAPTKILGGLGMTLGMDWIQIAGTTGSYDSRFNLKAEGVCKAVVEGPYQFGFVHVKAVDDTGHDRLWQMRVKYLELMDLMLSQIVARLWRAEQDAAAKGLDVRYAVLVTGDHSTPVMFGDHSHEPVPLALAHVRHIVATLGEDVIDAIDCGPLPVLSQHMKVDEQELLQQAKKSRERREAAATGREWPKDAWGRMPLPKKAYGDAVQFFDEISASRGSLGRFPSSQLMPLVRQFLGVQQAAIVNRG